MTAKMWNAIERRHANEEDPMFHFAWAMRSAIGTAHHMHRDPLAYDDVDVTALLHGCNFN